MDWSPLCILSCNQSQLWISSWDPGIHFAGFNVPQPESPPQWTRAQRAVLCDQTEDRHSTESGVFCWLLQDLPVFVEGGVEEAAATEEPIEEEFDLADILGEDVEGLVTKEDRLKQKELELEVGSFFLFRSLS